MQSNRQIFLQHLAQTSATPLMLEIVKAQGIYLNDAEGKQYMDLISGISVSNVGHAHPKVIDAIYQQSKKFSHLMVYGEFVQYPQTQFAEFLANKLPQHLNCVYFTNSGSEATEGAMKLAKRFTGRAEIISMKKAYHGSTQGALSLMGDEYFKSAFRPLLPATTQIRFNCFDDLQFITEKTAAVFTEPIQAEAGVVLPTEGYLQALRNRCDEVGALLVFDEIQTGGGRTGSWFVFETMNVVPDVLLLAKSLGGGLPLGAFISSHEMMLSLSNNPVLGHITTFGGNAVCCAAGLAAWKVIDDEHLINVLGEKQTIFQNLLIHREIKAVRCSGLLIAVEFETEKKCFDVIQRCLKNGLLTDWFLFASNCLRIAPPLIISKQEIEKACEIILKSIDDEP